MEAGRIAAWPVTIIHEYGAVSIRCDMKSGALGIGEGKLHASIQTAVVVLKREHGEGIVAPVPAPREIAQIYLQLKLVAIRFVSYWYLNKHVKLPARLSESRQKPSPTRSNVSKTAFPLGNANPNSNSKSSRPKRISTQGWKVQSLPTFWDVRVTCDTETSAPK